MKKLLIQIGIAIILLCTGIYGIYGMHVMSYQPPEPVEHPYKIDSKGDTLWIITTHRTTTHFSKTKPE